MSPPPDTPHPSAAAIDLPLRLGLAAYCLGTGIDAMRNEPPVFSAMFTGLDWSSDTTEAVVAGVNWLLVALAPLLLWRRASWLSLLVSLWVVIEICTYFYARQRFYELAPLNLALRLLAPLALIAITRDHPRFACWLLRFAAAATFMGHGIESIETHPEFVDYLIMAPRRIGIEISEEAAIDTLFAIGIFDVIAAVLILLWPIRLILYYMTAWGLVTALARVIHSGWEGGTGCLVRLIHCAGPLAVLLYLRSLRRPDQ